jgi:hypothetical protein
VSSQIDLRHQRGRLNNVAFVGAKGAAEHVSRVLHRLTRKIAAFLPLRLQVTSGGRQSVFEL